MKNTTIIETLIADLKRHTFEIGAIRPPSEGGSYSLLIRATRNCPWSKCSFCYGTLYNGDKFERRTVEEIKTDIQEAKAISEGIKTIANKLGGMDWASLAINNYGTFNTELDEEWKNFQCVVNVFNWLSSGARTAFLQDADSLVMRSDNLAEIVLYLKETFPSIERVTSYARAKTLFRRKEEELTRLNHAGLGRLHVGLESGDNLVLKQVNKGVTAEEQVEGGRKAKEAGFELSEYVMPGLGGNDMWEQHAINTAKVLSEINPNYIRLRPLVPRPSTPLFEQYQNGEFILTSPKERLKEMKVLIENLDVTGRVCFDHVMNAWYKPHGEPLFSRSYEGYKFPEGKKDVLALINQGLRIDESFHIHARDMIMFQHL